ncbi:MAG: hypothetical protein L3J04_04005 [Robiginitomaculum sp.]|nr:hypothetical protein [Robiginitomaculum sp.]
MAKYTPLEQHLVKTAKQGSARWVASFSKIEKILGTSLPPSARIYPEWWANENPDSTTKSQCKAWAIAGWKTAHVNISKQQVSFFLQKAAPAKVQETKQYTDHQLLLKFRWSLKGAVYLDHKNRPKFPDVQEQSAVYRLVIETETGIQFYIGETDNLRRRMQGYRTPGPTQSTNQRLTGIMKSSLLLGKAVRLEVMRSVRSKEAKSNMTLKNFGNRYVRCLFENAAIILAMNNSEKILNL